MSANIIMYPLKNGIDLPTNCPQSFIKAFSSVFGDLPCILTDSSLRELDVAARMYSIDSEYNPFQDIYDYLSEYGGTVRIVAEY